MATSNESLGTEGASHVRLAPGVLMGIVVGVSVLALLWLLGSVVLAAREVLPAASIAIWSSLGVALGAVTILRPSSVAVVSLAVIVAAAALGLVVPWTPLAAVVNFSGTWVAIGVLGAVVIGRFAR